MPSQSSAPAPDAAAAPRPDGIAAPAPKRRLIIDLARSLALLGMAIFHMTFDFVMLGWVAPEILWGGFFWYFPRVVAGSFIFLAGVGLWQSHRSGIRWQAFGRRLAKIVAAAALVSVATRIAMPEVWIFYGILHSIAVSSLLGLLVLRLPAALIALIAAGVFALPWYWSDPAFGGALIWTGLSGIIPATADFEPFFPWFAPFLIGIAVAKVFDRFAIWPKIEPRPTKMLNRLAWPGKHSLAVYLIHQPVLIAIFSAVDWLIR